MKGFALNDKGDVIITGNDIQMAADAELLKQKIRQILSTNQGEWWLDKKEGVPVQSILKKNPDRQLVQGYIRKAIRQVDSTLELDKYGIETRDRTLSISFTVKAGDKRTSIEMEM